MVIPAGEGYGSSPQLQNTGERTTWTVWLTSSCKKSEGFRELYVTCKSTPSLSSTLIFPFVVRRGPCGFPAWGIPCLPQTSTAPRSSTTPPQQSDSLCMSPAEVPGARLARAHSRTFLTESDTKNGSQSLRDFSARSRKFPNNSPRSVSSGTWCHGKLAALEAWRHLGGPLTVSGGGGLKLVERWRWEGEMGRGEWKAQKGGGSRKRVDAFNRWLLDELVDTWQFTLECLQIKGAR